MFSAVDSHQQLLQIAISIGYLLTEELIIEEPG
jgi:hypothetical protein